MRRMLITGAKGLLGTEIRDLFRGEYDVLATDREDCDVTRARDCRSAIAGFRPEVVVHCAAYTAVDRAESEEGKAVALNVEGTRNVARACREAGSLLVAYGSDYVFDGRARRPYREDDATHPLSAYGRSKRDAEKVLAAEAPEHLLIRSQWLYGPHGRNFVFAILEKARRGEPLRVVADQTGCPTYTRDLALATRRLIDARARGTFHFSNAGETTWFGFASAVLASAGPASAALSPARTADLAYPAPRPAYSVLSTGKYRGVTGETPRRWEEAVSEFLATLPGSDNAKGDS